MSRLKTWASKVVPPWIVWSRRVDGHAVQIELRQPLILGSLLVLLGWYIAAPSPTIAICLAAMAGLLAVSAGWSIEMARKVTGWRKLEYAAMQVGDELEEQVHLVNTSFLPVLWCEFIDRSDLPGYTVSGVRAVEGSTETNWRAHTICRRRGIYKLGPWELLTGDPFGIFMVRHRFLQPQQVLVYPQQAVLPADLLPHRGVQGDQRPLNQPIAAETSDGMSVRDYISGDPLHHIHWRTTARRNSPFVKVFEPEASSRVWILPDVDLSVQAGEDEDSTEEMAVLLTTSLAVRLLHEKLAVGLYAGGQPPCLVLPQRGQGQFWSMLERLAPLRSSPGHRLDRVLGEIQALVSLRDLLVVITPSLDPSWIEPLQRMTRTRGGGGVMVILIDPASFGAQVPREAAENFSAGLVRYGFQVRMVRKGGIEPVKGAYGALNRWEFSVSATGKAFVRRAPRRADPLLGGNREGWR